MGDCYVLLLLLVTVALAFGIDTPFYVWIMETEDD
jgi:hypothetical protein